MKTQRPHPLLSAMMLFFVAVTRLVSKLRAKVFFRDADGDPFAATDSTGNAKYWIRGFDSGHRICAQGIVAGEDWADGTKVAKAGYAMNAARFILKCKTAITVALAVVLTLWGGVGGVQAADATWTGTSSGAWRTTANWSTGAFPGSSTSTANTDIVTIAVSTQATMGINFNTATLGVFSFGGINFGNSTNRVLGNSAGSQAGVLTLNGATINSVSNVIFRNSGSGNFTFQASQSGGPAMGVALGSTTNNVVSVDSTGNVVFDSIMSSQSGTTPFTVRGSGSGRVDITNTANTFTGTINLLGAETRFTGANSYGNVNNTIVIDGGRLATASATSYTLASTHGIQVGDTAGTSISVVTSGTLTYGGIIANVTGRTGAWAKQGAGTLALGGASTYTGDTAINNGIVQLTTSDDRLPTGTTVSLGQAASTNLGTFDLNARSQQIAGLNSTTGTNATASNNTVTSATAATLTLGGSGSYSYGDGTDANSGIITGAISLVKSGSGTQTLGDANTYSGTTAVNVGVLNIRHATALGNTTGGTSVASGAALEIQGGITVGAEALTLNGTGVSAAGALRNISGANTYGGLLTLGSAARINSDAGSLSLSNTGTITGSGFGLTVGGAGNTSIAGVIGTGSGTLTKDGAGTVTLSGANTYTGATTISTGTLALGSSGSINSSISIAVASGATFNVSAVSGGYSLASNQVLSGGGSITGPMTVASGSTLSPGSSPGTLSQTGNQTWNGGGNYNWQLHDTAGTAGGGTGWDLMDITGALTIAATSGDKFNLNLWTLSGVGPDVSGDALNFNNASNYAWKIAAASAGISGFAADAFAINTAAANGTAGFSNALGGGTFSISQSGNDLNLIFTAAATGANLYWDGGTWTTTAPGTGGIGTWQDGSGSWDSSKVANFGGTAATVTIGGGGATANKGIIFLSDGYTLSGGTITLSATPADNVITVGSAMSATVSSTLSTTAGIIKSGAGTLILTTPQTYTGGTVVNSGTLTLGHATDTLPDAGAVTVSGGTLNTSTNTDTVGSFAITSGALGGSGTLTAATYALNGGTITGNLGSGAATASSGTTALNGTLAADLTVSGGTVNLGAADRLGNAAAVSISSGTLGMGANNDTVGSFAITGGTLGGSGTLTASTYSLGGGTVAANLGAGTATAASGTTALNGTLSADLTVSGGTVNLGSSDRLADASNVTISSGTLGMGANNDTVNSFAISGGTLSGSGTLTATTGYSLNGGTVNANLGTGTATASTGTTALNGTHGGDLAVSGGTVNLGSADRLSNLAAVTVSSGSLGMSTFNDTVGSFTLSGPGTLDGTTGTLTASTYSLQDGTVNARLGTGAVTVSSGTTTLGSAGRLGATSTVAISSGQLTLGGDETVSSFTLTGGTLGGSATLTAGSYALDGGTVGANLGTGTATAASGSTALNGTLAGNLAVTGGTVTLGSSDRIGGAVTVSSGALDLGGNSDIVGVVTTSGGTTQNGTLNGSSYAFSGGTVSAALAGSGAITAASGMTTLSGDSTGFTGATTVSGGTLALNSSTALGGSAVTMSSGSVLGGAGTTTANAITIGTASGTVNNPFTVKWDFATTSPSSSNAVGFTIGVLTQGNNNGTTTLINSTSPSSGYTGSSGTNNAGAAAFTGALNTGTSTYFEFTLTQTTATTVSLNDVIFGSRSTGTGPQAFTIRSTDALGAELAQGALLNTSTWALQSPSFADTSVDSDGTTFRIYGYSGTGSPTAGSANWRIDDLTLTGTSTTTTGPTGNGTLGIAEAGSTTFSGSVTVNNTATLDAVAGGTANFTNVIGGAGSITKTGAGIVTLSAANTYAGATTISAGTLQLGSGGTTGSLATTSAITNNGTFAINLSNAVTQGTDFSGSAISGSGGLTQAGAGTTTLTAANTYSGGTTVSAGLLKVTNTTGSATGSGNVTVSATSTILGSGIISPANGGTITVASTGRVAVGDIADTSSAKVLTFTPALGSITTMFQTGSIVEFDLFTNAGDNSAITTAADILKTGGSLVFDPNVTLRVLNGNGLTFTMGNKWTLLDWMSLSGTVSGSSSQLTLDLPTLDPSLGWDVSQFFVNGSISVIPEPSRVLLLGLGLTLLASRRRR